MLLFLVDLIILFIRIIFKTVIFIIKLLFKAFKIILTNKFLSFAFSLIICGYLLNIKFNILATLYFIYLTHLSAIKFGIYKKIYFNSKNFIYKVYNSHKVIKALSPLKHNSIILNNLFLEDDIDDSLCIVEDLVITRGCVFIIKNINTSKKTSFNNKANTIFKRNKSNTDIIVDLDLLNDINDDVSYCHSILKNILPSDIPINNIITLPNDNMVVINNNLKTPPIVSLNNLSTFIENNIKAKTNYSLSYIKDNILENRLWLLDIILLKFEDFLMSNKTIITFFLIYLFLYYLYNTSISYITLNFIK